jgi:hypothetical protein
MLPDMTTAEIERLKRVAFHEAGHAAAALSFGLEVTSVDIVFCPDSLGYFHYMEPVPLASGGLTRWCARRAVICLAGIEAEWKFSGVWNEEGASVDLEDVDKLARRLFRDSSRQTAWKAEMKARTIRLLDDAGNWASVYAIAAALMLKPTLDGLEAWQAYSNGQRAAGRKV